MASLARFDRRPAAFGAKGVASRFSAEAPGLATFRVLADVEYERSLSRLIESEIIPRLMVAHAGDAPLTIAPITIAVVPPAFPIERNEVEELAPLALQVEADALLAHIEGILARGVTVDTVLVDLLAPAARRLGEFWDEDLCDFVDVTMGLWRLQEVVHEIAARAPADRMLAAGGHRALFASMPGDQHNFGTVVVDELFRRDGWITTRLGGAETSDLLKCVSGGWFDMIGLTVSCDRHIATLTSIIAALRNVSKNPRVCILVGGRIFSEHPDRAVLVGADGTARDARLALKVAADLVAAREGEAVSN